MPHIAAAAAVRLVVTDCWVWSGMNVTVSLEGGAIAGNAVRRRRVNRRSRAASFARRPAENPAVENVMSAPQHVHVHAVAGTRHDLVRSPNALLPTLRTRIHL